MSLDIRLRTGIAIAIAVTAAACNPQLALVSPAPPARVARVNAERDIVELSEGVAVAIECNREGSPCKEVRAATDEPNVARVFPAHIARVQHGYFEQENVSSLALVAVRPGTTTLHVVAEGHASDYVVTVLPVAATSPSVAASTK